MLIYQINTLGYLSDFFALSPYLCFSIWLFLAFFSYFCFLLLYLTVVSYCCFLLFFLLLFLSIVSYCCFLLLSFYGQNFSNILAFIFLYLVRIIPSIVYSYDVLNYKYVQKVCRKIIIKFFMAYQSHIFYHLVC